MFSRSKPSFENFLKNTFIHIHIYRIGNNYFKNYTNLKLNLNKPSKFNEKSDERMRWILENHKLWKKERKGCNIGMKWILVKKKENKKWNGS